MVDTFAMVPSTSRGLWLLIGTVSVLLVGVILLLVATSRGARNSRFEIAADTLRLRGDLYGRSIPASAIRGAAARIVNLDVTRELTPRLRMMGTSIGSYQAGWFRLRNGEKALLYLTDRTRAVYVPTSKGYSLLLSPQEPDRFVERLRSIAPNP